MSAVQFDHIAIAARRMADAPAVLVGALGGPGIHHVTFRVPHLGEVCERAVAHGFRIVGHAGSDPGWAEAFLHPKEALGIVAVLGTRLRARSAERADTLWSAVLGGRRDASVGAVVYRWRGSPMRLAVDVDADADEGPTAVEFASARPVSLPQTPHPLLGASFCRGTA